MKWHTYFQHVFGRAPEEDEIIILQPLLGCLEENDPLLLYAIINLYLIDYSQSELNSGVQGAMVPLTLGLKELKATKEAVAAFFENLQSFSTSAIQYQESILNQLKDLSIKIQHQNKNSDMHRHNLQHVIYEAKNIYTSYRIDLKLLNQSVILCLVFTICLLTMISYRDSRDPLIYLESNLKFQINVAHKDGDLERLLNCNIDGFMIENNRCETVDPRMRKQVGSWVVVNQK